MYKANNRDFGWNIIADEFIIYSLDRNIYYWVNDIGKDIWEILTTTTEGINLTDIIHVLESKYECDEETVKKDLEIFITQLVEIGAVIDLTEVSL